MHHEEREEERERQKSITAIFLARCTLEENGIKCLQAVPHFSSSLSLSPLTSPTVGVVHGRLES
jgi:hypothetical protein